MRPHKGSEVRLRRPTPNGSRAWTGAGADGGCLASGCLGVVVEDDRGSSIPFKVQSGGRSSWYPADTVEAVVNFNMEDVVDQRRSMAAYQSSGLNTVRFSWEASATPSGRARQQILSAPADLKNRIALHARSCCAAHCAWLRNPQAVFALKVALVLLLATAFLVLFTAAHAFGYRRLKTLLVYDKYQSINGCGATQGLLGVARGERRGKFADSWPNIVPPSPQNYYEPPPPPAATYPPGSKNHPPAVVPPSTPPPLPWLPTKMPEPPPPPPPPHQPPTPGKVPATLPPVSLSGLNHLIDTGWFSPPSPPSPPPPPPPDINR